MKYLDEYRDPGLASTAIRRIRAKTSRKWTIMEVCGGQTHSLLKYGIEVELAEQVELLHGPGCPVCVTDAGMIDRAIRLAQRPGFMISCFGDMLRVPGTRCSLSVATASGASVLPVYSPADAVTFALHHRDVQVVFFAVGFETTAPATALAILQAQRLGLSNFFVLNAHVRVLPAMFCLMQDSACRIQAFLAAGHVCSVTGFADYMAFSRDFRIPVVVSGFEPLDLLSGIELAIDQLENGKADVINAYGRAVSSEGNPAARQLLEQVFEPCDREWRGMGVIPGGGFQIREAFSRFDADRRLQEQPGIAADDPAEPEAADTNCRAGEVLSGKLKPCDCPEFGGRCCPDSPLGAPMVSSEGACAAWFHYGRYLNTGGRPGESQGP